MTYSPGSQYRVNGRLVTLVSRIQVGDDVRYLVRYTNGIRVIVTPDEIDPK